MQAPKFLNSVRSGLADKHEYSFFVAPKWTRWTYANHYKNQLGDNDIQSKQFF
jgi:hypothetical protein